MILVVGQHPDPHIERVSAILRARGIPVSVLDRHNSEDHISFEMSGDNNRGYIHADGRTFGVDEVACVWWRVKPATPVEFTGGSGTLAEQFRSREWNALLRSLPAWLSHAPWINPLIGYQLPRTKPAQLLLAREIGFTIPDTVISNNIEDVVPLFERHAEVIYKTLNSFLIPPDKMIYTNIVTRDEALSRHAEIELAPCIFQGFVQKARELRVTVVGEHIFPVAINSQSDLQTRIDWRRNQSRIMYSATDIGSDLTSNLILFMKMSSLIYAAFDFVVTPDEQIVFLECNPGGQWLWLEKVTNLPISQAVADVIFQSAQTT